MRSNLPLLRAATLQCASSGRITICRTQLYAYVLLASSQRLLLLLHGG